MRALSISLGVLAIALMVAGCGGGETTEAPISKAQFIKQGDSACAKSGEEIESGYQDFLASHGPTSPNASQKAKEALARELVNTVLVPAVTQEVAEIRELGAPEGDEAKVDRMLVAFESGVQDAQNGALPFVEGSNEAFVHADELAVKYGFRVCGKR